MPAEQQARPAEQTSTKPIENATDKKPFLRILVVDDDQDSANSMAMLLKFDGHTTHTAYDGLQAVEAAATFRPDVVILDIGLPTLNGYEACRRIRDESSERPIKLIALTGWGQAEDRQKTAEAGFDAHLVETHHTAKQDAPSGTALSLATSMQHASGRATPVTSVRVGSVPGTHEVIFDGAFEQVRLVHEARDRRVFAEGALVAARWLLTRRGVFTMQDVLSTTPTGTAP